MKSDPSCVEMWETLAEESRYSVSGFARRRGVSERQFRRFTHGTFGQPPHTWLHSLRLRLAAERLTRGTPAKVAAVELGYKDLAHFSRDFKKAFGEGPTEWTLRLVMPASMENGRELAESSRLAG